MTFFKPEMLPKLVFCGAKCVKAGIFAFLRVKNQDLCNG